MEIHVGHADQRRGGHGVNGAKRLGKEIPDRRGNSLPVLTGSSQVTVKLPDQEGVLALQS